jgi:hypothetical protein
MKPYKIYSVPDELTSPKVAQAFHDATGFEIVEDSQERNENWLGFGSPFNWNTLQHAKKTGFDFVYVDHAYFHRNRYYRVTKNALFHDGTGRTNHARIRQFYLRESPWKKGKNIIICPQSWDYFKRNGMRQDLWLQNVIKKIKKHSDRRIIVHHKRDRTPLVEFLKDAWMVVSHTSNSGLEAIMNGVPTICTGECHVTPMATKGFEFIENPYYPENRMDWAGVLADNQFTLQEIRDGIYNDRL